MSHYGWLIPTRSSSLWEALSWHSLPLHFSLSLTHPTPPPIYRRIHLCTLLFPQIKMMRLFLEGDACVSPIINRTKNTLPQMLRVVQQAPYFWPSNCWEPENTDYAIYLCKRTMQNKARLELADYEAENLARLQRAFARKWEFIFMQAEAQVKIDRKKDKAERKILDSQERAFWDVHRPVPGCVNTTEMDIRKCQREKNPQRVKKVRKKAFSDV
ncbi:unnamed protein product [Oncorhynchus mykiss]|uniref:Regulator of G-protein signalling DHEX domain-containing protein n=1 Tax=Oncorhynchus mykiss TaxID=8022 RepID=A0A060WPH8_ONCMY|nr:unnamed protein product [Oncorhynchus mykiss]